MGDERWEMGDGEVVRNGGGGHFLRMNGSMAEARESRSALVPLEYCYF
jgi:hypothetical protein